MTSSHPLVTRLAGIWPPCQWQDVTVLVAVSGGPDSVALLRAMATLKTSGEGRLLAAHVNHQLRGSQSDTDEAFVRELCHLLGVRCYADRVGGEQREAYVGDGLEAAARSARYDALQRIAARVGARYVAAAHTADDQAETILHRIARGTGIPGLSGMARARLLGQATTLMRPLLQFRRSELLAYLDDIGQPYRSDPSNVDPRFTRNRIRHQLLPALAESVNPDVVDALLRLGSLAGEVQQLVDRVVNELLDCCVRLNDDHGLQVDVSRLAGQPRYVVRELLMAAWRRQQWPQQAMGYVEWDLLADMALGADKSGDSAPAKHVFPGHTVAESQDGFLVLRRPLAPSRDTSTGDPDPMSSTG